MHFVPVFFDDVEQFHASLWNDGAEGLSAFEHLDELAVGDDVIVQLAVRGTGQQAYVRAVVVWKRPRDDTHVGLPAAAGLRIYEADRARLASLAERVDAVSQALERDVAFDDVAGLTPAA